MSRNKGADIENSPLFAVYGPFRVPVRRRKGGDEIDIDKAHSDFWNDKPFSRLPGCYVFAIRRRKGGVLPWHVGKTTSGFAQEAFTNDKQLKYNNILNRLGSGTPLLFLLHYGRRKGNVNAKAIDILEKHLIREATLTNPRILNLQGRKQYRLRIRGVLHGGGGKQGTSARRFVRMLKG